MVRHTTLLERRIVNGICTNAARLRWQYEVAQVEEVGIAVSQIFFITITMLIVPLFFTTLNICHNVKCVHHCDQIPFFGRSYGNFLLMKNPMLKAQAFAVPPWCKRKTLLSAAH